MVTTALFVIPRNNMKKQEAWFWTRERWQGRDGQGNLKPKLELYMEDTSAKLPHEECLNYFRQCDNGQCYLFFKELMQEISREEVKLVACEVDYTLSKDIKQKAKGMKGFYQNIDNLVLNLKHKPCLT